MGFLKAPQGEGLSNTFMYFKPGSVLCKYFSYPGCQVTCLLRSLHYSTVPQFYNSTFLHFCDVSGLSSRKFLPSAVSGLSASGHFNGCSPTVHFYYFSPDNSSLFQLYSTTGRLPPASSTSSPKAQVTILFSNNRLQTAVQTFYCKIQYTTVV